MGIPLSVHDKATVQPRAATAQLDGLEGAVLALPSYQLCLPYIALASSLPEPCETCPPSLESYYALYEILPSGWLDFHFYITPKLFYTCSSKAKNYTYIDTFGTKGFLLLLLFYPLTQSVEKQQGGKYGGARS